MSLASAPSVSKAPFSCPHCGKPKADYRQKPDGEYNIACWSCEAAGLGGGDYLRALAAEVGAPSGTALIADAPRWLGSLATGPPSGGAREELPPAAELARWARDLPESGEPLRWLLEERGLSRGVVHRARIGWDGHRLIFPMYRRRRLVACKWRLPEAGQQMRAWAGKGREWPLYPQPPREQVLLCAGELDALCARSHGLPAVSVTLGAGHWRDAWTEELRGRRVFVCFDNNEFDQAWARVDALHAAGIETQYFGLRQLGFRKRKGDLSDYLNRGRAEALRDYFNNVNKRSK